VPEQGFCGSPKALVIELEISSAPQHWDICASREKENPKREENNCHHDMHAVI
jgi:hypothetical protein